MAEAAGGGGGGGAGAGGSGGSGGGDGGGSGGGGGSPRTLWAAYLALLARRPLTTKAGTSAALNAAGDALAQLLLPPAQSDRPSLSTYDWARTGRFALLGGALVGPTLHGWYGALGALLSRPGFPRGLSGVAARLVLDQGIFAPDFIAVFVSALLALEGRAQEAPAKLRADWGEAVRVNWALWIPAQAVNFRFVPVDLQVLFANGVALVWNVALSFLATRGGEVAAAPSGTGRDKGKGKECCKGGKGKAGKAGGKK